RAERQKFKAEGQAGWKSLEPVPSCLEVPLSCLARIPSMRAVLCKAYGPPESLVIEDLPSLEPGPGEVVVSVTAATVTFPDFLIIQNKYQVKPPLPFSPGSEVAGIVKVVGEGVTSFKPGDLALAITTYGAFAEEVKTEARRLLPIPAGMDFPTAAAFGLTYATS